MNKFDGSDLYKMFISFNVEMGSVDENSIKAWFDTYSEDQLYLLNWLCSLKNSSLLQPSEKDDYDELVRNNLVYSESECDNEINKITSEYPGLFDIDSVWDIELLENEITLLSEAETNQQNEILIQDHVSETISNEMKITAAELRMSEIKKNAEFEKCLKLAEQLDSLNEQLQLQIEKCGRNLQHFEFPTIPLFISNINMNTYNEYFNNMISYLSTSVRNEYISSRLSNTLLRNSHSESQEEDVDIFKERIFRSMWKHIMKRLQEQKLKAELEYLDYFESKEYKRIGANLDKLFREKSTYLTDTYSANLREIIVQLTDKAIYLPKVNAAKRDLNRNRIKLAKANLSESKVVKFLAKEILLCDMHSVEQEDIGKADKFFRSVLDYITMYLKNCEMRVETMLETIEEHKKYRQLPIEEDSFIKSTATILANKRSENTSLTSIVNLVYKLENETDKVSQQVFDTNFQQHQTECRKIEKWISKATDFLQSGASTKLLVVPPQLFTTFREIDNLLEQQNQALMDTVKMSQKELKKYSNNKWQQIRKQLWIYFITEPSKVESFCEQIKFANTD